MNSSLYPVGNTPLVFRWINGVFTAVVRSTQATLYELDGANRQVVFPDATVLKMGGVSMLAAPRVVRVRRTIAEINAGAAILPAIAGYKYQLVDAFAIAYGGAVGATTTVDLIGTVSTARKLVAFGQAALTQSALVRAGSSGGVILADGASFTQNDAGTAITVGKTGSDLTVATGVDFVLTYLVGL